MTEPFIPFDAVWRRVVDTIGSGEEIPERARPVYLVRNLYGQVGVSVSDAVEEDLPCRDALQRLADRLHDVLGPHGRSPQSGVLFVDKSLLTSLDSTAREVRPGAGVYLADRLVTGGDWWTVGDQRSSLDVRRFTLFSVKGGVGRSTTAAVLAWHLARRGERVLVADLDLESPGLSSAMLDSVSQPDFGITDWFVEDLVGQGEHVLDRMLAAPSWTEDLDGAVHVAPAHGRDPGEYLAKLGRVYMDNRVGWTARLMEMLTRLEEATKPTIVLLESRSGLHDIAAATVTDLDADVLLFAVDAASHWTDYDILFSHWRNLDVARDIRDRVRIVSALTPGSDPAPYLRRFRERSWTLFNNHLYDDVEVSGDPTDAFSFDLTNRDGPHNPIPILWTVGFSSGASLRHLEPSTVTQAYTQFFERFDDIMDSSVEGTEP
jgi:hypothetical protein